MVIVQVSTQVEHSRPFPTIVWKHELRIMNHAPQKNGILKGGNPFSGVPAPLLSRLLTQQGGNIQLQRMRCFSTYKHTDANRREMRIMPLKKMGF